MVHAVDAHSNKSVLIPPSPIELERLAQQARLVNSDIVSIKASGGVLRNLRRRLAPHVIAEMVARYNAGEDTPALSREYGISKTGLRELLQAEGVAMRRQAIASEDAKIAVGLYEQGQTIAQVVERIGYSYSTIRKALNDNGVAMRANCIKKRTSLDD